MSDYCETCGLDKGVHSKCIDRLDALCSENSSLRKLSDAAIEAALTLDKKVGVELIRLRTRLVTASTLRSKDGE